jgi:hypothetical protein
MITKRSKKGEVTEIVPIKRTRQPTKGLLNRNEGAAILTQLIGYTLIAGSHPQGIIAGMKQIIDDNNELTEYRASKRKKDIPK